MREKRQRRAPLVCVLLFSALASLGSGTALAKSALLVNGQITVQPITVCAQDTKGNCVNCSPVNDKGQTSAPDYIGFIDPATGANVTEEILTSELGIRVTWLPLRQYCSPINTFSSPHTYGTSFQTLHIYQDNLGNILSDDFMTLAQQPFNLVPNSNPATYTVPNPTNPPGATAPPCLVDNLSGTLLPPCVPVSINPTTMNMFFVNNIVPISPLSGKVYGYGMISGNGVAINAGADDLSGKPVGGIFKPAAPTLPQIDVPGHEIVHDLGLLHVTTKTDLEAPGGTRTVSSLSTFFNNLTGGKVDQLDTTQFNLVTDPSSYLRLVLDVTTTITAGTPAGLFNFTVSAPATNTSATTSLTKAILVFDTPKGFQPSSFTVTNNPDNLTITGSPFNGNLGNDSSILCGSGSFKCWEIDISPGLAAGDTFSFALKLSSSIKNAQLSDLADSKLTHFFGDQFATTSDFSSNKSGSVLTADTLVPDLTIAAFIADPSKLPKSGTPCTLSDTVTTCSFKAISDGDIQPQ